MSNAVPDPDAAPDDDRETQAHAPETKAPDALDLDALLGGL